MLAYLVIREGTKWTDVFRLVPGQAVTVGRAPTNQIVIKDERCSRAHAEVFYSQGHWIVRDLESRNGTTVGGMNIRGDHVLEAGEIIRIGHSQMAFVYDLTKAFPDSSAVFKDLKVRAASGDETTLAEMPDDGNVLATAEPTTITHRRGQTKFLEPVDEEHVAIPKVGRAAAQLCRLAFELAQSPDINAIAQLALAGVFEGAEVDAGAILLLPRTVIGEPSGADLEVLASRSDTEFVYHRVSNFLASTVLREGEAVLARNVLGDSALGGRDSKGEIHATSVLCAPIRRGSKISGLIHLYSTDPERIPDPDDLEFTLAVADTVAVALENLSRRQELAENLSQIRDENLQLRERLGVESEIVGNSPVMARVSREISRAAPSRATVLIRGESGVGKELVARAVHFASPRRKGPFVCLNCAALTESLLESELFGHERGAFTGATERKIGKFEAADTGTLMLDEIGEMSSTTQAKFLRVLEGHPFERV
ncbi:MAG TPA: sigma 54-interacting transcriptional regulator, partial [Pirellulales bacterium]|nr:sigma 54-interacting transcriptional regulator [Pirellulales bacterium]